MKDENSIFTPSETTLHVDILLLPDSNMLALAAAIDPMRAANRRAGKQSYDWRILSFEGGMQTLTSGIELATSPLSEASPADVLIVIAGFGLERHSTPRHIAALRRACQKCRAIGGVDGGSWILARAGLLDGVTATTHWEGFEVFIRRFPNVDAVRDRFAIDGRFFTTGGASPCIDLMLHLIRCRQGQELAMRVASAFIYDPVHPANAPQSFVSTARLARRFPVVAAAIQRMENALEDPPPIAGIARAVGLSTRALEIAFQRCLGVSPGQFFLGLRLQEAHRLVEDSGFELQEVAVRTGFRSQSTFARAFRARYGQNASKIRQLADATNATPTPGPAAPNAPAKL